MRELPFSAKAVANYFLELAEAEKRPLTPMKLQKLVYYAHGWCLGLTGQPLLDEVIQAWSYGPVVRSVYNAFREFGASAITGRAMDAVFRQDLEMEVFCPTLDDDKEVDSRFAKKLLKRVWEVYGGYSAVQLSNMTHAAGTPWAQVNEGYGGDIPKYETIPNDLIAAHFKKGQ